MTNKSNHTPIQLVVFDLDGTLIDIHHNKFHPAIFNTIGRVLDLGVKVTLATGRSFTFTRPLAASLDLRAPLICYQGALIQAMDGSILKNATFSIHALRSALELSRTKNWQHYLEGEGTLFLEQNRHYDDELFSIHAMPTLRVPDLLSSQLKANQFSLYLPDGESELVVNELQAAFGKDATVMRTHSNFVNAIPTGVSKGSALAWLANELAIPQQAVLAVGDSDNDVSMLSWAGVGVAMGGARPAAIKVADWVAPPMSEQGAVTALERFVLGRNY